MWIKDFFPQFSKCLIPHVFSTIGRMRENVSAFWIMTQDQNTGMVPTSILERVSTSLTQLMHRWAVSEVTPYRQGQEQ